MTFLFILTIIMTFLTLILIVLYLKKSSQDKEYLSEIEENEDKG